MFQYTIVFQFESQGSPVTSWDFLACQDANEQLGMDVKHRLGRLVVLAIHRGAAKIMGHHPIPKVYVIRMGLQ